MKNVLILLLCAVNLFGQKNKVEKTFVPKEFHIDTVSTHEENILISIREGITFYYNNGNDSLVLIPMYNLNTKTNTYQIIVINIIMWGIHDKAKTGELSIQINKCEKSKINYGFDDKDKAVCYSLNMFRSEKLKHSIIYMFSFNEKYLNSNSLDFTKESICGMGSVRIYLDGKEIVPFKNREPNNYFALVDEKIKQLK